MQRLVPSQSLVAVIDVQERLVAAMPPPRIEVLTQRVLVLLEAAKLESVRVLSTEQYPKGLGHTIPVLAEKLAQVKAKRVEKLAFSAVDAPEFALALDAPRPTTIVVVGMEAHVCVYQTVRDLVNRGLEVHVPVDAVISRRDEDRAAGLSLCERAGGVLTTMEAIVFDWLGRAGTDEFRAISKLLR